MSDALTTLHRMGTNLVVQAGAGTGKTFNLVQLYVHLLAGLTHNAPRRELELRMGAEGLPLGGEGPGRGGERFGFRPDQIVAMTFTDKAAAEMRERIQAKLGELERQPEGDPFLRASASALGRPLPSPRRWRELRLELSHAFIGTFHSYCGRILRENAVAAGVDPHFALLGAQGEDKELFEAVAKEVLLGEAREGGASWKALYRYQLTQDSRFGGGLIEHLRALYDRLQVTGIGPERLLEGGPYTEAGAREALSRALGRYARTLEELADAADQLSGQARAKLKDLRAWLDAHGGALRGLDERSLDEAWALADQPDALLSGGQFKDFKPLRVEAQELREAVESARRTFEAIPLAEDVERLLVKVTEAFHAAKAERGALDFQDLLVRARDLLRDRPAVRRQVKADVGVLLVDEFQDTDQLQKDLVYLLAEAHGAEAPLLPGEKVERRLRLAKAKLFVVGDRKQSIYAFRGADVEIFEETLAELSGGRLADEPAHPPLSLNLCRRSLPPLIEACNVLFSQVMGGEGGSGFHPSLDALGPHRPDPGQGAAMELMGFQGDEGDEPAKRTADDRARLQARAVAARIHEIVEGEAPQVFEPSQSGEGEAPRPPRYRDITILLRRYKNLAAFTTELILRRIPHVVVKGRGFYGAQEVRDLVNLLRLVVDPEAHVALLGVLRSPLVGLSDEALVSLALSRTPHGLRLRQLMGRFLTPQAPADDATWPPGLTGEDVRRLTAFLHLHRRLRRQADRLGCAGLIEATLQATAFDGALAATFQGEQKVANVEKLLSLARAFDEGGTGGVPAFAARMLELLDAEPQEGAATVQGAEEDVVKIMTVHASKGLEFPIVIVPECESGKPGNLPPLTYDKTHGFALSLADPTPGRERVSTGAYDAIKAAHKARGLSESQRLLYVATTRAREHVILVGEGKGRGSKGPPSSPSWQDWIDAATPALADRGLLTRSDGLTLAALPYPDFSREGAPRSLGELRALGAGLSDAAREAGRAALAAALPPPPEAVRVKRLVAPVTQLDDFQLCARRYLLWHELSLEEHPNLRGNRPDVAAEPEGAEVVEETAAQLDPLRRGTLAHALLEAIDLAQWQGEGAAAPALIDALLEDQGYTLSDPQVAGVRDDVASLLMSPFGQGLAATPPHAVKREWPFTLRIEGEGGLEIFLTGKMDLLIEGHGAEPLRVVDYKHTRREGRTAEDYRFQLMSYALAARTLLGATDIRAEIVFLKDRGQRWDDGPMALTPTAAELDAFEGDLATLGADLIRARLADRFRKSAPDHCRAIHCGYLWRCHPQERGR